MRNLFYQVKGGVMNINLIQQMNKQMNLEFYGAYLYYAMASYFEKVFMAGFSLKLKKLATKRLSNAQKITDYLILRNEKLSFNKIEEPLSNWKYPSEVYDSLLNFEDFMLKNIYVLYGISEKNTDKGAIDFIYKLLIEQEDLTNQIRKIQNKNLVAKGA